jgi:hypothetical protein
MVIDFCPLSFAPCYLSPFASFLDKTKKGQQMTDNNFSIKGYFVKPEPGIGSILVNLPFSSRHALIALPLLSTLSGLWYTWFIQFFGSRGIPMLLRAGIGMPAYGEFGY